MNKEWQNLGGTQKIGHATFEIWVFEARRLAGAPCRRFAPILLRHGTKNRWWETCFRRSRWLSGPAVLPPKQSPKFTAF